jgi:hypothetical protein
MPKTTKKATEESEVLDLKKLEKEKDEKIVAIEQDVAQLIKGVDAVVIQSDPQQTEAIDMLSKIKGRLKRIEDLRKFFVQPLNDTVKKYNNQFKLQTEPLEKAEKVLKAGLLNYQNWKDEQARIEAEKRRQEEAKRQAELAKEAEELGMPAPAPAPIAVTEPDPDTTVRASEGKITYQTFWNFQVEDMEKLPKKFKDQLIQLAIEKGLLDSIVRNAIKEGITEIPGVKIWQDRRIASS